MLQATSETLPPRRADLVGELLLAGSFLLHLVLLVPEFLIDIGAMPESRHARNLSRVASARKASDRGGRILRSVLPLRPPLFGGDLLAGAARFNSAPLSGTHWGLGDNRRVSDAAPPRPDAEHAAPILKPPRGSTSPGVVVLVVVCSIVAVAFVALIIVAAVNSMGKSAEDQFKQVQVCVDHPKDPSCKSFSSP